MANNHNLIPAKKGEVRNPNGRPRKWVSTLTAQGYKNSEVADTIQVLMSMTIDELKSVYEDKNSTVLEKTVANAIRKSIEKGTLYSMDLLWNRVFGKPKEQMDLNASGGFKIEVTYKDANDTD